MSVKSKDTKKKDIKKIVIIIIVFAVAFIAFRLIFADSNPFYVVASGSMIPVLNVNDLIVVWGKDDNTSFESADVNDVIVFRAPDPMEENKTIVHRVAQVGEDQFGNKIIMTKGDANPYSIPGIDFPITEENYVGKVVYVIPQVGIIPQVLKPPVNYLIMAIIGGLLVFSFIRSSKKEKLEGEGEEREKIKDE